MGPYILSGLVVGSVYAVSVLGLVLTYNSSRVFNFSHGAIAYVVAVTYYWLTQFEGWSVPLAAAVCIVVVGPLIGLVLFFIVLRRLTHAPPVVRFVSTVGLWVAIPAFAKIVFGTTVAGGEVLPPGFGGSPPGEFTFLGVVVNWNQASVIIGAALIAIAFSLMLRYTPLGLATRAAVDSPRVASIAGINPTAISAVSWMLGCGLAGLAGVLLSPVQGLGEIQFTLLLVVSFAAVVVGRMRSLPLAFAGAMGIGLIQGLSEKFITIDTTALGGVLNTGFRPSVPFIIMLVFLLAYQGLRREQFEVDLRAGPAEAEIAPITRLRGWRAAIGPLAVAVGLFSVPMWPGIDSFWLNVISQGLALSVLFLTFTVLTGEGGMLSLAQITLAGLGAFTAAKLATDSGWPVWAALLVGGLVCIPIGLLVAGMSLRLGGLYLALATLAFSQLVKYLVFARSDFDNLSSGVDISRPKLFGINFEGFGSTNFYLLLATVFCVIALLVVNLRRSSTGLVLTAMRSSEAAAATIGISVVRSKLIVFGLSSFIAGLGGGLFAVTIGSATVNQFEVLVGIVWLALVVTWGIRSVLGALMAGILLAVVPYKLGFILVIIVVFIVFGLSARLIGSKAIYTPRGAVLAAGVVVAGIAAIVGLTSLVIEAGQQGAGLISFQDGKVLLSPALFAQGPTLLFGLGAVFLAKQPRGVLFDLMNRIRLRQLQREARLAEAALAPARGSEVPA